MNVEIYIQNGSKVYQPAVCSGITWSTERKGSPGKLKFSVVNDGLLNIQEGNSVKMLVDGKNVFYGYIFDKDRSEQKTIDIIAYDQLRYFKNKDTYSCVGEKASELLKRLCKDFALNAGNIEDTGYIIPKRLDEDKTLFDIMQGALDNTMLNTQKIYVLYDEFGAITLKNIASMKVPILIDSETSQTFRYKTSIDSNTYNRIKLSYENESSGKRDIFLAKDSENINNWGMLQYYEKIDKKEGAQSKAEKLLAYYNRKTRNLKVNGCFGDVRVRAGTAPLISLDLGDVVVYNFMTVTSATHTFNDGMHTMDLTLEGGDFVG